MKQTRGEGVQSECSDRLERRKRREGNEPTRFANIMDRMDVFPEALRPMRRTFFFMDIL
jgi:hypothetical protein